MVATIRVTQLDGKLPNLALMRLAAWHREQGDNVYWQRGTQRGLHEPDYDIVYGSAIFTTSAKAVALFRSQFPHALIGGWGGDRQLRVEDIVPSQFTLADYSGFTDFTASLGYTMRGCRFKCGFCMVPKMEGRARSEGPISAIWRGEGHPKHIHLLDNDFFGNPVWRDRVDEIEAGGFRVCINQGINVRLLDDDAAAAIVRIAPYGTDFKHRRLYTAWDNIGDEQVFFDGVDRLERAGWPAHRIMAYMLVGYDPRETWERIFHRFDRMVERRIEPYVMVFGGDERRPASPEYPKLKRFQRWSRPVVRRVVPDFRDYDTRRDPVKKPDLFETAA